MNWFVSRWTGIVLHFTHFILPKVAKWKALDITTTTVTHYHGFVTSFQLLFDRETSRFTFWDSHYFALDRPEIFIQNTNADLIRRNNNRHNQARVSFVKQTINQNRSKWPIISPNHQIGQHGIATLTRRHFGFQFCFGSSNIRRGHWRETKSQVGREVDPKIPRIFRCASL